MLIAPRATQRGAPEAQHADATDRLVQDQAGALFELAAVGAEGGFSRPGGSTLATGTADLGPHRAQFTDPWTALS